MERTYGATRTLRRLIATPIIITAMTSEATERRSNVKVDDPLGATVKVLVSAREVPMSTWFGGYGRLVLYAPV